MTRYLMIPAILFALISVQLSGYALATERQSSYAETSETVIDRWNDAVAGIEEAVLSNDAELQMSTFQQLASIAKREKPLALFIATIQRADIQPLTRQLVIDILGGIKRDIPEDGLNSLILDLLPECSNDTQDVATRGMLLRRLVGCTRILQDKELLYDNTKREVLGTLRRTAIDETEDTQIRGNSIHDLARFGDPVAKATAMEILRREDKNSSSPLLTCSMGALAVMRETEAVPLLIDILRLTENERNFGVCTFALARIGSDSAIHALVDAKERFSTLDVRSSLYHRWKEFAAIIKGESSGNLMLALRAAAICRPPGIESYLAALMVSGDNEVRRLAAITAVQYLPNAELTKASKQIDKSELPVGFLPYVVGNEKGGRK